jgi:hypothetical protein
MSRKFAIPIYEIICKNPNGKQKGSPGFPEATLDERIKE